MAKSFYVPINLNGYGINSVADPTSNQDAATKIYVDKKIQRVTAIGDGATLAIDSSTTDVASQVNTQAAAATLTISNPTGTPIDEQKLFIRIKTTNVVNLSFGAAFRGSQDLPLPSTSSGSAKWDRFAFIYNSVDSKWDFAGRSMGY